MTKLEEEILYAIDTKYPSLNHYGNLLSTKVAQDAAKVAKKYIEKAYDDAIHHWLFVEDQYKTSSTRKAVWLKENGITE